MIESLQFGKPLLHVGAVAIGPFIVTRRVKYPFRVQGHELIVALLDQGISARFAATLHIAQMNQERKRGVLDRRSDGFFQYLNLLSRVGGLPECPSPFSTVKIGIDSRG